MAYVHCQLSLSAEQREVESAIDELVADPSVDGIFIQLPLPPHLDSRRIVDRIPLRKDVDGLSASSLGALVRGELARAPATPTGILALLELYGIPVQGARVMVLGKSVEIARALVLLFAARGAATVTLAEAAAPDLPQAASQADILVSALERPGVVTAAYVKPGAVVVDAGYNRTPSGVVGDVDERAVEGRAAALVTMPGGIGPVTIACLLENTWNAARERKGTVAER